MDNNQAPQLRDTLTAREYEILQRLSAGLSDQQIADALFLSSNTVRWYNRQIYSKLGVSSRTQAIARAQEIGLLENPDAVSPLPASRHNLPLQSTPFIGRSRETAEAKRLLQTSRLLTLTGVGGTGKTRLALCVASDMRDNFADGVYFIDLAPVNDPALVAKTVAAVLNVFENPLEPLQVTLKRALAEREMLLLIDNFEHIIKAAPLVSDLLAASPRLKVLVTSREALRLSLEQEYPVAPLSLPSADAVSVQDVTNSEAGALFIRMAQTMQPRFTLSADNASTVAKICARLDGLPLAIELAAARCKLLPLEALLDRLDSRLNVLTSGSRDAPARQRTLRNTLAWSFNLLNVDEKMLFARLAVFRGGCSLEAAEAICGHDLSIDLLDGLASLVDKSLVQPKETTESEPRFVMLETIHEYAWEQLDASEEGDDVRRRHAEYFVGLAERAAPELRLALYDYWCQRFEHELDNFRSVLEWALGSGDLTLGVRLAGAMGMFWYGQGYHVEGYHWTQQLLEHLDDVPLIYHPQFFVSAGHLASLYELDTAKALFLRDLAVCRELGDQLETAWALIFLSYAMQGEPEAAMPVAEEGLALARDRNHQPAIAQALNVIGEIARINGDDDRAKYAYDQCLAVCQQTGEARRICYMYYGLSHIAQHEGDAEQAMVWGQRGLRLARERKDTNEVANGLAVIAGCLCMVGETQRAARLLGASEAAAERMGAFHHPSDRPEIHRIIATVRGQLDEASFYDAWIEGKQMRLEQAVAAALEESV